MSLFPIIPPTIVVPAFIDMDATQFTLGDTAQFDWTGSNVDPNALDKNIRTALTLVSSSQDFDFRTTGGAFGTISGPSMGFYDNGTTNGAQQPTTIDDIVYTENGGAVIGWIHANGDVDGAAKSAGWMAEVIIQISRRGSTFYGLIDDVLDRTFTEVSGTTAGGFFIGCSGASHAWQLNSVQYRLGPGLPSIS